MLPIDCMKWNNNRNRLILPFFFYFFLSFSWLLPGLEMNKNFDVVVVVVVVCLHVQVHSTWTFVLAIVEPQWTGLGLANLLWKESVIDSFEWMFMDLFLSRINWFCLTNSLFVIGRKFPWIIVWYYTDILWQHIFYLKNENNSGKCTAIKSINRYTE